MAIPDSNGLITAIYKTDDATDSDGSELRILDSSVEDETLPNHYSKVTWSTELPSAILATPVTYTPTGENQTILSLDVSNAKAGDKYEIYVVASAISTQAVVIFAPLSSGSSIELIPPTSAPALCGIVVLFTDDSNTAQVVGYNSPSGFILSTEGAFADITTLSLVIAISNGSATVDFAAIKQVS